MPLPIHNDPGSQVYATLRRRRFNNDTLVLGKSQRRILVGLREPVTHPVTLGHIKPRDLSLFTVGMAAGR